MKIITLTLNPAFDIHCNAENFTAERENIADITSKCTGGKGINISRALAKCGIKNTAFVVLGNENAEEFCKKTDLSNIDLKTVTVDGRIRENITVHTKGRPETRISFTGFKANDTIIDEISEELFKTVCSDDVVVLSGRLPVGVSIGTVKNMLTQLRKKGIKTVIDSQSFTPDDLLECRPFLIKPNQEEIASYCKTENFSDVAGKLHKNGIENVMVSLGKDGALLVCNDGIFTAKPPKIQAVSTIGAGDSMIAGFLSALLLKKSRKECLINAVAFGTAKCLKDGTNPPRIEDIERIKSEIEVK